MEDSVGPCWFDLTLTGVSLLFCNPDGSLESVKVRNTLGSLGMPRGVQESLMFVLLLHVRLPGNLSPPWRLHRPRRI